ncbi:hypothetical protein ACFV7Q_32915 [Streptomyces sp. NPDC059851]|uniref:hypothetical protein n=1 Tax=Streptomyces sp. NPDC059851 TaxID=3346971 RepID=UPI00365C1015
MTTHESEIRALLASRLTRAREGGRGGRPPAFELQVHEAAVPALLRPNVVERCFDRLGQWRRTMTLHVASLPRPARASRTWTGALPRSVVFTCPSAGVRLRGGA